MDKHSIYENMVTVVACALCVTGLAAFSDGSWGWGFLILININST